MSDSHVNQENNSHVNLHVNQSRGRPRTLTLFFELAKSMDQLIDAPFTLKGWDYQHPEGGLKISLKRLFLEEMDPVGYTFAEKYLSEDSEELQRLTQDQPCSIKGMQGYHTWKKFFGNKRIRKEIEQWQEDLQVKLKTLAVKSQIRKVINEDHHQAAKWLAAQGWVITEKKDSDQKEPEDTEIKDFLKDLSEEGSDLSKVVQFNKKMNN